jgi:hypothetical protein
MAQRKNEFMNQMNKKKISMCVAVLLSFVGFIGCASSAKVDSDAAQLGYGEPLTANYQDIIKAFMEVRLKDSSSAIYKFTKEPYKAIISKSRIQGRGIDANGWLVTVLINAKNSYGGYSGFDQYEFMLRDNRVIRYRSGDSITWYKL